MTIMCQKLALAVCLKVLVLCSSGNSQESRRKAETFFYRTRQCRVPTESGWFNNIFNPLGFYVRVCNDFTRIAKLGEMPPISQQRFRTFIDAS
jgi:hypothetical protein